MNLKVISWNIWGGKNRDQVIDFLKNTSFDVAALQEVTERVIDGEVINDAQVIADSLGYNQAFAKSFTTDRHTPLYDMGNAIISRYPLNEVKTHILSDLSTYERNATTEPRNSIQAQVDIDGVTVTIISTHLGYSETLQATPLQTQQVSKLILSVPTTKTVLMGDFNSEPSSQIVSTVLKHFEHENSVLTQPTWTNFKRENHPQFHIDYIFNSKDITINNFEIKNSPASDHLPLIAELEL